MKKTSETVLTIVIVFLFTWSVDSIADYYRKSKISAMFGPMLELNGNNFLSLDISNYGDKMVNQIRISIPKNTNVSSILSSNPIQIKEFENDIRNIEIKRLEISGIEANQMTRLYIPLSDKNSADLCNILNIKDKNLEIIPIKDLKNPFKKSVKNALYTAIIYALLLGFFYWLYISKQENIRKELRNSMKRVESFERELIESKETWEKKGKNLEHDLLRMKALLLSRLSDYSKELTFWRDTIRKILYSKSKADKIADTIIKEVTDTLKTYGTLSNPDLDFETVKMLSIMTGKQELKNKKE